MEIGDSVEENEISFSLRPMVVYLNVGACFRFACHEFHYVGISRQRLYSLVRFKWPNISLPLLYSESIGL